jgi:hypothetical protein
VANSPASGGDFNRPRVAISSGPCIHKSPEAERRIYETYFLAKAGGWAYEQEWRDIATEHGSQWTTFPVRSIYFGFRCPISVRVSVMALLGKLPDVTFYEIYPKAMSFDLDRRFLNVDEELAMGIRTSPYLDFGPAESLRGGQIAPKSG